MFGNDKPEQKRAGGQGTGWLRSPAGLEACAAAVVRVKDLRIFLDATADLLHQRYLEPVKSAYYLAAHKQVCCVITVSIDFTLSTLE
jgi:hypothetical protein